MLHTVGAEIRPLREVIDSTDHGMVHYTVQEIADEWKLDAGTVRALFRDEPGVLKIGLRSLHKRKRAYVTLRIPADVRDRVRARLGG